jgi:hypothetical protein
VKGRASSFIEGTATVRAEEGGVAKFGFLRSLPGGNGSTIGAVHQPMLLIQLSFSRKSITEMGPLCQVLFEF